MWFDGDADFLYARAGLYPEEPAPPEELAIELECEGVFEVPRSEIGGLGEVEIDRRGRWFILLADVLRGAKKALVTAHEIAEWHAHEAGMWFRGRSEKELFCDAVGRALIVPRGALRHALREHGEDLPALAARFKTYESVVALRLGESKLARVAVVSPMCVDIRGEPWGWPGDWRGMQRLAKGQPGPGLRKVRCTDEPSKVVLWVA